MTQWNNKDSYVYIYDTMVPNFSLSGVRIN